MIVKVFHMPVDILDDEACWVKFASKIKKGNLRRQVFQQEFAWVVTGWRDFGSKRCEMRAINKERRDPF